MTRRPRFTQRQRDGLFIEHGGRCHLCGRVIAEGEPWHVEHPKARGLGGSDKLEHMRPAHIDCHAPKTAIERRIMAKADKQRGMRLGTRPKTSRPLPGTKASGWKHTMAGEWVRR